MVNMGKVQRLCLFLQKGFQKQNISKHGAQGGSTWNWLVGRLGSQIIKPYLLWWVTQLPTRKRWPGRQIGSPMKIWKLLEAAAFWRLNADIPSDLSLDPHLLVWDHGSIPFRRVVRCLGTPQAWWANPRLCWESHDLGQTSQYLITGWWFGTCFMTFHSVGNVIIPTDKLIFFRGVGGSTTNQL